MKRIHAIDILRALAILWMVQIHFVDNLGYWSDHDTLLYEIVGWFGIIPAPLFTFLAGVSLYISLGKYPPDAARRKTLRRGLAIFLVGLLHYVVNWGTEYILDWDILTFIGSSLIVLYLMRSVKTRGIVLVILGVLALSPILRSLTDYNQHWNFILSEYTHAWTITDIFLGWLLHGYFPMLPWIVFPLAGYTAGRAIIGQAEHPQPQHVSARTVSLLGGLMILLGVTGVWGFITYGYTSLADWRDYFSDITFYPASTTYLLILLGICLASFGGLWLILDSAQSASAARRARWEQSGWIAPLQRYSRYSLSTYIIHHSVHLWPLYLAGWRHASGDRWYYYGDAIPVWAAVALWGMFMIVFYFAITQWDEVKGRYSLEWLLARIDIRDMLKIIATSFIGYLLGLTFGAIFGIFIGGIPSILFREIVSSNQTVLMSIAVSLVLGVLLGYFAVQLVNKFFAASDKPLIGVLLGLAVSSIIVFILGGVIDISDPNLINRPMYIIPFIYCGRVGSYIGGIVFPIIGAARIVREILPNNIEEIRDENRLEEFQKFLGITSTGKEKRD